MTFRVWELLPTRKCLRYIPRHCLPIMLLLKTRQIIKHVKLPNANIMNIKKTSHSPKYPTCNFYFLIIQIFPINAHSLLTFYLHHHVIMCLVSCLYKYFMKYIFVTLNRIRIWIYKQIVWNHMRAIINPIK